MEPTYFAQYKGFDFHCSPVRTSTGGFMAQLLVSARCGSTSEIDIPVPVQGEPFLNATAAALCSFWQGRRWVDSGETGPVATVMSLPPLTAPEQA